MEQYVTAVDIHETPEEWIRSVVIMRKDAAGGYTLINAITSIRKPMDNPWYPME